MPTQHAQDTRFSEDLHPQRLNNRTKSADFAAFPRRGLPADPAISPASSLEAKFLGRRVDVPVMRTFASLLAGFALLALAGCRTAHAPATAATTPHTPARLTSLAAGDALGLALHEHYVMVSTLRGETKPVAVTRK